MAKCPQFDTCPISNQWLGSSREIIDMMVNNYCNDRFTNCAVYKEKFDFGAEAPNGRGVVCQMRQ